MEANVTYETRRNDIIVSQMEVTYEGVDMCKCVWEGEWDLPD